MTQTDPPAPSSTVKPRGRSVTGLLKGIIRFTGALLLLLVSAWFAASTWIIHFPPNLDRHAARLAGFLSARTGVQVALRGLDLKAGVALTFTGQGLTLTEPGADKPFLQADAAQLRFSPLDWFQDWRSVGLVLKGVFATVQRTADGRIVIGGWDPQQAAIRPPLPIIPDQEWFRPSLPLISHVSLRDAHIVWEDQPWQTGGASPRLTLKKVNLSVFSRENNTTRITADGVLSTPGKRVQGRWKLEGELGPGGRRTIGANVVGLDLALLRPYMGREFQNIDLTTPLSVQFSANWGGAAGPTPDIQWRLRGSRGRLTMPGLFRWPLPVGRLKVDGRLRERSDGWNLQVDDFHLTNEHGRAEGRFSLAQLGGRQPAIDLTATVSDLSCQWVKHYYPAKIMYPALVNWLDSGLSGGKLSRANVRIEGPLSRALFVTPAPGKGAANGQEVGGGTRFRIEGDVTGLDLAYLPDLPPLEEVTAHLVFDHLSMSTRVSSARMAGVAGIQGEAAIANLIEKPRLTVSARIPGSDLGGVWKELVTHPKLRWDRAVGLEGGRVEGAGSATLNLDVPLLAPASAGYSGHLDIQEAELHLPFLDSPIRGLKGAFDVNREQLRLTVASARFKELPLSGHFKANEYRNPARIHLTSEIRSILGEERISSWFSPLLGESGRFSGPLPLELEIASSPGKPLFMVSGRVDAERLAVEGVMNWRKQAGKKGEIRLKGILDREGLLRVKQLRAELGNLGLNGSGTWSMAGKTGMATLKSVHLGDNKGRMVITQSKPMTPGHGEWHVDADMEWLDLSVLLENEPHQAGAEPGTRLPQSDDDPEQTLFQPRVNLKLAADRVILANGEEGRELRAKMELERRSIRVKSLSWRPGSDGYVRLDGELLWPFDKGSGFYAGRVHMENGDFGHLLRSLDVHDGLVGSSGELTLKLNGFVPPGGRLMDHLSGEGEVVMHNGTIRRLGVLSTILGLFSLQELPNLVVGDRPDLAGDGFRFDRFKGPFTIQDSVLTMADAWEVDGPSMKIVVSGAMNFPDERL